jgi:hypothetical protein
MQAHEQFLELCSLAAIGELSPAERRQLDAHLRGCSQCRKELRDNNEVATRWLPLAQRPGIHAWLPTKAGRQCRKGFLERARAAGLRLSTESQRPPRPWTIWPKIRSAFFYTATAAAAVALTFVIVSLSKKLPEPIVMASRQPVQPAVEALQTENSALRADLATAENALKDERASFAAREKAAAESAGRARELEQMLEASRREVQDVRQQLAFTKSSAGEAAANLKADAGEATAKLEAGLLTIENLSRELDSVRRARAEDEVAAAALQGRMQELSMEIRLKTATADRGRELLSADKDIRDIMGARDLHIIDVHETDSKGKQRAAFGRIFYTENRSLVFYAFDLDRSGYKNASFQAWGQRDGDPSQPAVNLGVMYVDDQKQSRWVLKLNDAVVLRQIDSVFVTASSPSGRDPSGRKLLYAYFGNLVNHP